ncbi:uncharacterized protein LOC111048764 isoform X2 [Nilaparvata lugens]|nr:uncharacterized protein LOC111048764 isoform X2 [Nilaparvata lugens]
MEYHVCGKIAKVIVNKLEDISPSRPQIKVQIKIEKQEDEFGECEFANSNVKDESFSHNGSTSNQIARVKQENDSSQEPAPESSTACSPTDNDFSQQHYLIPGYNLIFIKEEEYGEIHVIISSFLFINDNNKKYMIVNGKNRKRRNNNYVG